MIYFPCVLSFNSNKTMIIKRNKKFSWFGSKKFEASVEEPETYVEMCKMYPKYREIDIFVKNQNELHNIAGELDDRRIIVDFEGFNIMSFDFDFNNKGELDKDWLHTIREKLGSNSWIPAVGDLFYNKDDNNFYVVDLYSSRWKPKIKKSSVKEYKKELIETIVAAQRRDEFLGQEGEGSSEYIEELIPRLKKILQL